MLKCIEEPMEVPTSDLLYDVGVVPVPNDGPVGLAYSLRSNGSRHAKAALVVIVDAVFFEQAFEVALAEIGLVHAHGIGPYIYE